MTRYKLDEMVMIPVILTYPHMDKSSDLAYDRALDIFGIDENGHINNVHDAHRSESVLVVEFDSYKRTGGMGGQYHTYNYKTWIQSTEE